MQRFINNRLSRLAALGVTLGILASSLPAAVTRLEITERITPTFDGKRFGAVGPYEYLIGRAYGELDPGLPTNAGIVNLDRAPKNAAGRVDYSVDVTILKPVDLSRGNGAILYDVLNRGTKRLLTGRVNGGRAMGEARSAEDAGTGFLMTSGFTMVWSGWQGDVVSNPRFQRGNTLLSMMAAQLPVANGVTEPLREEFNFDKDEAVSTYKLTYPTADRAPSASRLTIRQRERDPRVTPPDLSWEWVSASEIKVHRPAGFDAGAIYELIYPARDPIVMGIGFAATRDVIEFLRHSANDQGGNANPLFLAGKPTVNRALALGISQSGRYLKDFLYQGFNTSERDDIVFDGVLAIVAGSRRTMINLPFSKPGDFSREHETHLARGDQFPFTYATYHDAISGKTDGILAPLKKHVPKIMHIDTDTEMFQARAALVVTDSAGHALTMPENVRTYFIAGSQHAPAARPTWSISQRPLNPLGYGDIVRALIAAMDAWVHDGTPPPPSRYPSVADGTLVAPDDPRAGYPNIPGFRYHGATNVLRLIDETATPTVESSKAYPAFVPARDKDGNNIAGVRHPLLAAPLGTHTGWNLRDKGFAYDAVNNLDGSFVPFARTKAEREKSGDARASLEERYASIDVWIAQVSAAADQLVQDRFLLRSDADQLIADIKAKGFEIFGPVPPKPDKPSASGAF